MQLKLRRLITSAETRLIEAGLPAQVPLLRVVVTAVVENPYVDRYVADLSPLVEASVSFFKHSRKPSFSLGLQRFLELLFHKIGVPRVSHRVHEIDAVSQKQLDKTIVHSMHAVFGADLN